MSPLQRWLQFNFVGGIGMAVQLAALALINRAWQGHYLYASAIAIELAVLHNFLWHIHYTWRERQSETSQFSQLLRFHLSNGIVSLLGNLVLMRLLVGGLHLPVLLSNLVAICCCSIANFYLSNNWAFATRHSASPARRQHKLPAIFRMCSRQFHVRSLLLAFAAWMLLPGAAAPAQALPQQTQSIPADASAPAAQPQQPLPVAPNPVPPRVYHSHARESYYWRAGTICGAGMSTSPVASRPTVGCGAGITFVPLPLFVEVGVMAPQANRSYLSGYITVDSSIPLAKYSAAYSPQAIVGYSRLFETGHSFDYGLALALPRPHEKENDGRSLRVELRDYWTFANPMQHNIMLRLGWMDYVRD